jgi:ATP-dependent RNA helicase DDX54/DBP10
MPARSSSPARSENEFDISNALFADDVSESAHDSAVEHNKAGRKLDNGTIPDIMAESSDMDDEAAIAQQQAQGDHAKGILCSNAHSAQDSPSYTQ